MAESSITNPTPAQEEFQSFLDKNTDRGSRVHPEDRDSNRDSDDSELDEEDRYRNAQIDGAMRTPAIRSGDMQLPPASFDSGCATGVKGVIADARAYEQARQGKWRSKVRDVRQSIMGLSIAGNQKSSQASSPTDSEGDSDNDEEAFLQQWREARRIELENESRNVRNRRTSPSLRTYGRMDSVDALGYLDAIEKVGRDTVVVVFVYDHEVRRNVPHGLAISIPPCKMLTNK
ncbi:hypothetical protein GGR57DRAFT_485389 [Xylariaceae sp. FL1272]|nr:hypothetical protein GGR57DRAFT_485389 [Xylariaceae sp. FL1272]